MIARRLRLIKRLFEPNAITDTLSYVILWWVIIDLFALCIIYENYVAIFTFMLGIIFYIVHKHLMVKLKSVTNSVSYADKNDPNATIILPEDK